MGLAMNAPSDLLTPGDVAKRFGVGLSTVARWADEGRLPAVRTVGGHRRFRRHDVDVLTAELATTFESQP
jgi:excisionase family DNA binding protein